MSLRVKLNYRRKVLKSIYKWTGVFRLKKIAIIGASYLQVPAIEKAKEMGYETHVFAWAANDIGEKIADYFYPISIVEKEQILKKCQELQIDGICTIASDLAVITVNYVAELMKLVGNTMQATVLSTNKHEMRKAFTAHGDPSPKSICIEDVADINAVDMEYPLIVKPLDRSGSRGITKIYDASELNQAIAYAKSVGFDKRVLVEEFVEGDEYSVEAISYQGTHHVLAITKKYTTGAPHFIETGHLEPAGLSSQMEEQVFSMVVHALDSLQIKNGASHTEFKITPHGALKIIEIGGRMGGDFIGSNLVQLSTGVDFVENVIRVAMGQAPDLSKKCRAQAAGVRFVFAQEDAVVIEQIKKDANCQVVDFSVDKDMGETVTDSSNRHGYCIFTAEDETRMACYLKHPNNK